MYSSLNLHAALNIANRLADLMENDTFYTDSDIEFLYDRIVDGLATADLDDLLPLCSEQVQQDIQSKRIRNAI